MNTATKTLSDDWHIPSLLYAGRFTYMPKGVMPATQGNPNRLNEDKIMLGVSTSINVESESESTNDFRAGLEFAMLKNKWYLGQMNPQITPLMPVLVSPWLSIHVSLIMMSYALLAFMMLNGVLAFMDRTCASSETLYSFTFT